MFARVILSLHFKDEIILSSVFLVIQVSHPFKKMGKTSEFTKQYFQCHTVSNFNQTLQVSYGHYDVSVDLSSFKKSVNFFAACMKSHLMFTI